MSAQNRREAASVLSVLAAMATTDAMQKLGKLSATGPRVTVTRNTVSLLLPLFVLCGSRGFLDAGGISPPATLGPATLLMPLFAVSQTISG